MNKPQEVKSNGVSNVPFEEILRQKQTKNVVGQSELKFSKHAVNRLSDRNISLTDAQNVRLENGVKQASEKGITESLVLVDSLALIVNVPNKTVVTALDQTDANSNIFTKIDGAVICGFGYRFIISSIPAKDGIYCKSSRRA